MTRDEVYASDRGEREYYQSKRSLKERLKLPLTKDGCEALLEIVTEALEIPLDSTTREVFCGWVHHTPQNENSFTLGELGKVLFNNIAKNTTWKLDQECKEKRRSEQDQAKLEAEAEKPPLSIAKDSANEGEKAPVVQ